MTEQERNDFIAQGIHEGRSLSDIQKQLAEEHGVRMTYLDLRLLAADLKVTWKEPAKPRTRIAPDLDLSAPPDDEGRGRPGKTAVSVSRLVRPGAAISGEVTFASGARAEWYVDAMGRLGLNPAAGSSQPTADDIREFQIELQRKLGGA